LRDIHPAPGETIEIATYANTKPPHDCIARIVRNGFPLFVLFAGADAEEAEAKARAFWVAEVEKKHGTQQARARSMQARQSERAARLQKKDIA
jgi:hypothetical protein